jgi:hypothetical protein
LSHRFRDDKSQQAKAAFKGERYDGCFSARDAYVKQFFHIAARCLSADTLKRRLDVEDNLQPVAEQSKSVLDSDHSDPKKETT